MDTAGVCQNRFTSTGRHQHKSISVLHGTECLLALNSAPANAQAEVFVSLKDAHTHLQDGLNDSALLLSECAVAKDFQVDKVEQIHRLLLC